VGRVLLSKLIKRLKVALYLVVVVDQAFLVLRKFKPFIKVGRRRAVVFEGVTCCGLRSRLRLAGEQSS
jgi:hypothetical protein